VTELSDFSAIVLLVSGGLVLAVLSMRAADRISLPSSAIFLLATGLLAASIDALADVVSIKVVERIGVAALIVILLEGGMHVGLGRFRRSAGPIVALGIVGTFATAGIVTLSAHYLLGLSWITSGLIGAAIAPTDPAVTFSVLGDRKIRGRSGTILEGEAGVNDPVAIALMIGLIELATTDDGNFGIVAKEFAVEMAVGLAVGIAGGLLLLRTLRRIQLTSSTLHPILLLGSAGIAYGVAGVAHGSGFLAVFVAGILLGDAELPRQEEIGAFLAPLAEIAEIGLFAALGLSVGYSALDDPTVWGQGIVLAVVLVFVARPLVVAPLLIPASLERGERMFISWAGLKGAVPILLGALVVLAGVDAADQIYGIVFVVVLFSIVVQGVSIPRAADRLLGRT